MYLKESYIFVYSIERYVQSVNFCIFKFLITINPTNTYQRIGFQIYQPCNPYYIHIYKNQAY